MIIVPEANNTEPTLYISIDQECISTNQDKTLLKIKHREEISLIMLLGFSNIIPSQLAFHIWLTGSRDWAQKGFGAESEQLAHGT